MKQFDYWTVIKELSPRLLLCRCRCGTVREVVKYDLVKGTSRSCGCRARKGYAERLKKMPEYHTWRGMIQRCINKNSPSYRLYGGRGISIHPTWRHFRAFLADVGRRPGKGFSLNRIDNDGNYVPGNVEWATARKQQRNRRNNRLITHNGATLPVTVWMERLGINVNTFYGRLQRGWTAEEALSSRHLLDCPNCGHRFSPTLKKKRDLSPLVDENKPLSF